MLNWKNIDELYEESINKLTYKTINYHQPEFFYIHLIKNRNPRKIHENKTGPYPPGLGRSKYTRALFRYQTVNTYNRLPPSITRQKHCHQKFILHQMRLGDYEFA